jgi:formylmethanofuran dehydrogenase subunit E
MAKSSATVVICDACGERVAELVADDRRALCSECHLAVRREETPPEETPEPRD